MPKKTTTNTKESKQTPGTDHTDHAEHAAPVPVQDPGQVPEVVDKMYANCLEVAQDYINSLDDPEEIKSNNGLFVGMLKHIYRYYLGDIIGNKNNTYIHYDYELLDKIFYIYCDLVYKYKQNKRASILEFTIFVCMDRNTLYHAAYNLTKKLTPHEISIVKRWYTECENSLTNGSGVFEIFLLKSQYRYNDNLAPLPVSDQQTPLSVGELPDLGIAKIANNGVNDPQKGTSKQG